MTRLQRPQESQPDRARLSGARNIIAMSGRGRRDKPRLYDAVLCRRRDVGGIQRAPWKTYCQSKIATERNADQKRDKTPVHGFSRLTSLKTYLAGDLRGPPA